MCKCAHFYLDIKKSFIKRKLIFGNTIIYFILPVLILDFQGSMIFLVPRGLVFIILPLRESSSCVHPLSSPPHSLQNLPYHISFSRSHTSSLTLQGWLGGLLRAFPTFILNGSGKMPRPPQLGHDSLKNKKKQGELIIFFLQ